MRKRFILIVVAFVIVSSILLTGTNFYLDMLWFKELQVAQVFWTQYLTRWGMRLGGFLFLFVFLFVNMIFTKRYILSFPNLALRERLMATGFMSLLTPRRLTIYIFVGAGILAYILSGYAGNYWMELLRFLNQVTFNISDPVFGTDVAFYVFRLPFYRFIYGFLMMALVINIIVIGA
ncbi:MAG: UPF0182 family protein, partial [Clostridia bacterium]|nr:UPF0182 family protein [Clostridia bacterium]